MYVCVILGIPERVDYAPGSGREDLFPTAQLKLCDVPCTVHSVQTKLTLATSHIGKGCDRDTYSVQSQRKLCGNTKAYFTLDTFFEQSHHKCCCGSVKAYSYFTLYTYLQETKIVNFHPETKLTH